LTVDFLTTTRLAAYAPLGEKYRPSGEEYADGEPFRGSVRAEFKEQVALLREIAGNPFRPVAFDPVWRTPVVARLAQAAYDERILPSGHLDPARLAVVTGALEEAGCSDPAIRDHLRGSGPHARGCWVVDLILDKE
jgi:hypothetical protein